MTNPAPPTPAELASAATALVRTCTTGVLATISVEQGGWPHGSLAPYVVARDGSLVMVLSDLAEHTRNVRADPRASLFVHDSVPRPNAQSAPRLCAMGRVTALERDARDDARARYVARHPEAAFYLAKLDFRVYSLGIERVHLVGGFGRVAWLEGSPLAADVASDPLVDAATDVCAHMNGDHADALALYLEAFRGRAGARARMTGLDAYGFDVADDATDERFRFDFEARAETPEQVRKHVVAMARDARTKLGR